MGQVIATDRPHLASSRYLAGQREVHPRHRPGPWGPPAAWLQSLPWAESKLIEVRPVSLALSPLRVSLFSRPLPSVLLLPYGAGVRSTHALSVSLQGHQTSPSSLGVSGFPSRMAANGQSGRKRLKGQWC